MNKISIAKLINLILILVIAIVLFVIGSANYYVAKNKAERDLSDRAQNISSRLASSLADPMWNFVKQQGIVSITSEMLDNALYSVVVLDSSRNLFAGMTRNDNWEHVEFKNVPDFDSNQYITYDNEILRNDNPIGTVVVYMTRDFLASELRSLLIYTILAVIGVVLVLNTVLYVFFRMLLITPLQRLRTFSENVQKDLTSQLPDGKYPGEINSLKDSLLQMVANLKRTIEEVLDKEKAAQESAQSAASACTEAEEAREQALRSRSEGMLQAAASIEGVVERMTSASEELSAQVEEASRGAEEQRVRTDETATAMEEMNATVLEVAKNASHAAEGADKARSKAQEGAVVVGSAVQAINQVQDKTEVMTDSLGKLGQQAEQIGRIMTVIEDIADQTNLLALNAAIEAARAGDAGRGFAVVADEVRKLAEKTMNATKEVGQAIFAIQEGTKDNIKGMEQAGDAVNNATGLVHQSGDVLQEIVQLVDDTADLVRSIATAAEEQSAASEEINRSVEDINRISSETSEVMNQSAHAISELAKQAVDLQELVQRLKQA